MYSICISSKGERHQLGTETCWLEKYVGRMDTFYPLVTQGMIYIQYRKRKTMFDGFRVNFLARSKNIKTTLRFTYSIIVSTFVLGGLGGYSSKGIDCSVEQSKVAISFQF